MSIEMKDDKLAANEARRQMQHESSSRRAELVTVVANRTARSGRT